MENFETIIVNMVCYGKDLDVVKVLLKERFPEKKITTVVWGSIVTLEARHNEIMVFYHEKSRRVATLQFHR